MNKRDLFPRNKRHRQIFRQPSFDDEETIDIIYGTEVEEDKSSWAEETIHAEINSIDDLISLGEKYSAKKRVRYNIDVKTLNKLVEPLKTLRKMIGMDSIKEDIVNQIIYFMQDFEEGNSHMLHTVIMGDPGCGKTEMGKILGKIYSALGFLKSDKFVVARRSDLIGEYLGSTAIKTQKMIDSAKGGVLFIDEAYSLGNSEKRDSFSKECIDTINQNLSENKTDFVCIIAGYEESLKSSFFAYNAGLERRFPFKYKIDKYKAEHLKAIFDKIIKEHDWKSMDLPVEFFEKNYHYFKFNGGDLETLFQLSKVAHARRVFCLDKSVKKILTLPDLEKGLDMFKNNDEVKSRSPDLNNDSFVNLYM